MLSWQMEGEYAMFLHSSHQLDYVSLYRILRPRESVSHATHQPTIVQTATFHETFMNSI